MHSSVPQGEKPLDMSMGIEQDGMEPRRPASWKRYLHAEVSNKHTDLLMLACCVISGLSDSTIYNGMLCSSFYRGWMLILSMAAYGTFVSMQTG